MPQTIKIIFTALLALAALLTVAPRSAAAATVNQSPPASGNLQSGLVGWWTFDGPDMKTNVKDKSGQNNNGYMTGFTSTSSALTAGKIGQGLRFDGVNDYVTISNISYNSSQDRSFTVWIKPLSYGQTAGRILDLTASPRIYLNSSNEVCVDTVDDVANTICSASNSINYKSWQYIAVYINSTEYIYIYINGQLAVSGQGSNQAQIGAGTLYIGNRYTLLGRTFNGSLDDVRIYNRALSAAEIRQLYNLGR